ncbi:Noc2p [Sugiyamaella lignohabitans]|uniref:Noc2p n=1 Tax=Sugiyamaella lignohabitans TaxID=796027 RepID=A0A161HJ68_9ASCO|nr:Noc2p [Sugiyamaella lignohabitans]ANB12717.1 Noc2p [Sugiyamaella lignohabitans]
MAKPSKATKKFQKSHLKRTVDQRRVEQKYKQKHLNGKKKGISSKRGRDNGENDSDEADSEDQQDDDGKTERVFGNDSVEEFLEQDDLVPKMNGKKSKSKKQKAASHKDELASLAEKDPEFYKYLQENDKDLLNFDPDSILGEDDDEEEEAEENDEDEEDKKSSKKSKKSKKSAAADDASEDEEDDSASSEVTAKDVGTWAKSLKEEKSLRALRKVLKAFSAAVHMTENNTNDENEYKYSVTDPEVFNSLMLLALEQGPAVIRFHLPLTKGENGAKSTPVENKKLKSLSSTLRSHLVSLTVLLNGNHNKSTITLILKSVLDLLPYFLSYRNLIKDLVNAVVKVWGSSEDDEARLAAFSFLKTATEAYQKSLLEVVLKSTYGGIVKASRRTTVHTMPSINLMKNSAVTLFGIDATVSYQQGFQFIRQLAVHLRTSISNKTAESYKAIYNWQYCHSLDFWSRVISYYHHNSNKANPLHELIHPLVQITLGAIRLIPTPQYFPLRFYLIRSLLRISQQTGVYIPILPLLMEILSSTIITKQAKPSTLRPLDFDHNIRAGKAYLGTRVYQDGVSEQFIDLVGEFFVLHSKSIAFPELSIPAIIALKRFAKRSKNVKFNKQIQRLVEKLDQNTKFIEQKRNNVDFGPTNKEQVNAFLKDQEWQKTPLGAYIVVQREVREERARILRESLEEEKAEESSRKNKAAAKANGYDESDIEMDLNSESESESEPASASEAESDDE